MKRILPTALAFMALNFSFAQQHNHSHDHNHGEDIWCGKNKFTKQYFDLHPEAKEQAEQENLILNEAARTFQPQKDGPYIVPVVVHVIHANGEENISDEQIHSAIEELNKDFNAENSDIGSTASAFADIVADVGIEFVLARKDPQGNCTNGINRVYDQDTFDGGEGVKTGAATTWGRSSYLNIWTVNTIEGGTAAYAFLPSGAPASGDGILIEHEHMGAIGTSQPYHRHTLSHEVGHWLNLEHTWGGSNTPGLSSNCNGDDGVSDTPNTIGRQAYGQNCNLNEQTCGSLDNVQNMMDYGWCYTMFTNGQKNRMLAAIESGISNREDLWSEANLEETGLLDPEVVCSANFSTVADPIICVGSEVSFIDLSYNGVTQHEWTFEGGSPASSNEENPTITYNEPGVYSVTLTASNANGEVTETKTDYVSVLPFAENDIPYYEGFDDFSSLEPNEDNWFVNNPDGTSVKWQLTDEASVSGSNSVFVNGRSNPTSYESIENLLSPTYDLSGVQAEDAYLSFKYAHARRLGSSDDRLRVFISKNCGENWSLRESLDIDELPTVPDNVSGQFVPESDDDWAEVLIDNISPTFMTESFRIRFEYKSFRGNNIYIDDINLFDPSTVGLEDVSFLDRFDLYPNPSTNMTNLDYTLKNSGEVTIDVIDLSGRVVNQPFSGFQAAGEQFIQVQTNELQQGVYLVRMQSNGEQIVRKLIKH